jgi:CubicO group peptidase (beta-lactamase class C family)
MHNFVALWNLFDYFYQMDSFEASTACKLRALETAILPVLDDANARGVFSAAAVLVATDGIVSEIYRGTVRTWDTPEHAAPTPWPETGRDTRFDLASLTKPIVAAAFLAELDARGQSSALLVSELLPEFATKGLAHVTVGMLLGHTAGFCPEWLDRRDGATMTQFRAVAHAVDPHPGHQYSCVGYIWAGLALEAIAQQPLANVLQSRVLAPLTMMNTGFRPPIDSLGQIAATEFQGVRGLVHGEVHDEASWTLGGATGNAGLFGTARDVMWFAEALRTGLTRHGTPVFSQAVLAALRTPLGTTTAGGYQQALGPRVNEPWSRALGSTVLSHTGFTGTAFATEAGGRRSVVFFTNRVHPTRASAEVHELRERIAEIAARIEDQP